MPDQDGFWKFVQRFKLLIELMLLLAAIAPPVWSFVRFGLAAQIPVWYLLVSAVAAGLLGFVVGRGRNMERKSTRSIERREYFGASWEIDKTTEAVDGPFCKTCAVKMVVSKSERDLNSRTPAIYVIYACRNPGCPDKGNVTKAITGLAKADEALDRVREHFRGETRRAAS